MFESSSRQLVFFLILIFAKCLHALKWWFLHSFDCMHQWIYLFDFLILRAVVCDSICSLRSIWAKDVSCSVDSLAIEDSRFDVNRLDQRVAHFLYHFSFLYFRLQSQIVEIASSCSFELTQVVLRLERSWRHWWNREFWLQLRSRKTWASRRRTASIYDSDQRSTVCNHSARDSHCFSFILIVSTKLTLHVVRSMTIVLHIYINFVDCLFLSLAFASTSFNLSNVVSLLLIVIFIYFDLDFFFVLELHAIDFRFSLREVRLHTRKRTWSCARHHC